MSINEDLLSQCLQEYGHNPDQFGKVIVQSLQALDEYTRGKTLLNYGYWVQLRANYTLAEVLYQRALTLFYSLDIDEEIANCLNNIALTHQNLGQFSSSIEYYSQAIKIDEEHGRGNTKDFADTKLNLAVVYEKMGQYQEALIHATKALDIHIEHKDQLAIAGCWLNLGIIYSGINDFSKAEELYLQAMEAFVTLEKPRQVASTSLNLGMIYYSLGRYEDATEYLEGAKALYEALKDQHGLARCYGNFGLLHAAQGHYQESIDYQLNALSIYQTIGDLRGKAMSLGNLGDLYYYLGDNVQALAYHEQQLAIHQSTGALVGQAAALNGIGMSYAATKEFDKAVEIFKRASVLNQTIQSPRLELTALFNIGTALYYEGKILEAKMHLEAALKINKTQLKSQATEGIIQNMLGNLYLSQDEFSAAEQSFIEAKNLALQIKDPATAHLAYANLFQVYGRTHQYESAIEAAETAISLGEQIGENILIENHSVSYWGSLAEFYQKTIFVLAENAQPYHAWNYLERGKSRALIRQLQTLTSLQPNQNNEALKELLEHEKKLLDQLMNSRQFQAKASLAIQTPPIRTSEVLQQLSVLHSQIQPLAPEYIALRRGNIADFAQIKSLLTH